MEQITENADSSNSEMNETEIVAADTSGLDATALKAKLEETEAKNRQLFERAKRAEGFTLKDGHWVKVEKPAPKPEERVDTKAKTGELDEAQLDFFELKGYSDPDEVEVFANIMKKTGMSHREVLKDDYAIGKVTRIREEREVKKAMPKGTNRGSGGTIGIDAALAKFEQTGELPADFDLRTAVVNAQVDKQSSSLPPWRR